MKTFNGYRSWNQWNAVLWLQNDYGIEQMMRLWTDKGYSRTRILNALSSDLLNNKTPDGAIINRTAIKEYIKGYYG